MKDCLNYLLIEYVVTTLSGQVKLGEERNDKADGTPRCWFSAVLVSLQTAHIVRHRMFV